MRFKGYIKTRGYTIIMQVPHRHKKREKINIRNRILVMVLALMTIIGALYKINEGSLDTRNAVNYLATGNLVDEGVLIKHDDALNLVKEAQTKLGSITQTSEPSGLTPTELETVLNQGFRGVLTVKINTDYKLVTITLDDDALQQAYELILTYVQGNISRDTVNLEESLALLVDLVEELQNSLKEMSQTISEEYGEPYAVVIRTPFKTESQSYVYVTLGEEELHNAIKESY